MQNEPVMMGKLRDLEQRVRLLTDQLEEEKKDIHDKLGVLVEKVLSNFGSRLGQARQALVSFMKAK